MGEKTRRTGRLGGVELLAQELADEIYRRTMEEHAQAKGDSPIERTFYTALRMVAAQAHRSIQAIYGLDEGADLDYWVRVAAVGDGHRGMTAFCFSQVQVAGWRVDFVIHYPVWRDGDYVLKRLIVECDGHDFHERTKDQAKRDRSRDRLAQYEGLPVFRFTGSEIWNDPQGCADEVLQFMESGPEALPA